MKMPNSASMSTYTTMMRVNSDGRPFAKDLCDLFSALLIQLPLSQHRSFFKTYPSTFTTDEAVEKLGHLEVTNLVYTPNPLDTGNPILTRTTTTFSMAKDMAKVLAQHFINARLMESATDPQNHRNILKDKRGGNIWALTPKGKFMIQDFSQRARVPIKHLYEHFDRVQLQFPIIQFERLYDDDQISYSRQTMVEAFKQMMSYIPTDTIMIDDIGGLNSVNFIEYRDTFYGYQSFEWICEYTSVVSREEAESVASEFLQNGWMAQLVDKSDREAYKRENTLEFDLDRRTQYYMTEKGRLLLQNHSDRNGFSTTTSKSPSSASIPTTGLTNHSMQRSRNQSSTTVSSSGNSSVITNNSKSSANQQQLPVPPPKQPQLQTVVMKTSEAEDTIRPDYVNRLRPTTNISITELKDMQPKASITKHKMVEDGFSSKDSLTKEINSLPTDSVFQLNSNYDFGFTPTPSTASSNITISLQANPTSCIADKAYTNKPRVQSVDACSQMIDQLQIHVNDTSTLLRNSDTQPTTPVDHHVNIAFISHARQNSNSQLAKLQSILEDSLTRMYFRQFLKSCFCEENINFWVDYTNLLKKVQSSFVSSSAASSSSSSSKSSSSAATTLSNIIAADSNRILSESQSYESLLTHCYVIYNNYFCPETAPSELNIDHGLRYDIAQYIESIFQKDNDSHRHKKRNNADGDDCSSSSDDDISKGIADAANVPFGSISVSTTQQQQIMAAPPMSNSASSSGNTFRRSKSCHRNRHSNSFQQGLLTLKEINSNTALLHSHLFNILRLYAQANEHICLMMAEDSVPRFLRTQKYKDLMTKAQGQHQQQQQQQQFTRDLENSVIKSNA